MLQICKGKTLDRKKGEGQAILCFASFCLFLQCSPAGLRSQLGPTMTVFHWPLGDQLLILQMDREMEAASQAIHINSSVSAACGKWLSIIGLYGHLILPFSLGVPLPSLKGLFPSFILVYSSNQCMFTWCLISAVLCTRLKTRVNRRDVTQELTGTMTQTMRGAYRWDTNSDLGGVTKDI
jgi:hypothetical protein